MEVRYPALYFYSSVVVVLAKVCYLGPKTPSKTLQNLSPTSGTQTK